MCKPHEIISLHFLEAVCPHPVFDDYLSGVSKGVGETSEESNVSNQKCKNLAYKADKLWRKTKKG